MPFAQTASRSRYLREASWFADRNQSFQCMHVTRVCVLAYTMQSSRFDRWNIHRSQQRGVARQRENREKMEVERNECTGGTARSISGEKRKQKRELTEFLAFPRPVENPAQSNVKPGSHLDSTPLYSLSPLFSIVVLTPCLLEATLP